MHSAVCYMAHVYHSPTLYRNGLVDHWSSWFLHIYIYMLYLHILHRIVREFRHLQKSVPGTSHWNLVISPELSQILLPHLATAADLGCQQHAGHEHSIAWFICNSWNFLHTNKDGFSALALSEDRIAMLVSCRYCYWRFHVHRHISTDLSASRQSRHWCSAVARLLINRPLKVVKKSR